MASTWKEVPSLYQQAPSARVFATLNQARRQHRHPLRRRRGRLHAAHRPEQYSGELSHRIRTFGERCRGFDHHADGPAAGSQRRQQSAGGDRRAGRAVGRRHSRQRAALGADARAAPCRSPTIRTSRAAFAGIAKAYAIWIPSGPGRGVFITVAAAGGSALPPGNPTLDNLITALHNYGNPLIPIHVQFVPGDAVQLQRRHQVRPGL